jgi:replicative DNA helicase
MSITGASTASEGTIDLEQALLGAAMMDGRGLSALVRILAPDSFHDERHMRIAAVIISLHTASAPVDIMTVTQELIQREQLASAGGVVYVSGLTNRIASTANSECHARLIAERHALRSLARVASDLVQSSGHASDPFDAIRGAQNALSGVMSRLTAGADVSRNAAEGIGALVDTAPTPPGYNLGVAALDQVLSVQPGLPYVFAGRPGMGKSIMSCAIAWHMTLAGEALLFSPEMTLRQVQARILSLESGVPYSTILARRMDAHQVDLTAECANRIAGRLALLRVNETSAITPEQVHAAAERFRKETGSAGFVLDHLHKMSTGDRRVDKDETPRVSQCMEGLTRICKDTGLFGVIMCQLNRQVESRNDRRPRLADLKQTGRIEEDAAGVVLLYRDGYYQSPQPYEDLLEMAVAKNRDGSCDVVSTPCVPALNRVGYWSDGAPLRNYNNF